MAEPSEHLRGINAHGLIRQALVTPQEANTPGTPNQACTSQPPLAPDWGVLWLAGHKPWFDFSTFVFALAAVGFSIWTRIDRWIDRRRKVKDDFWFQKVAYPMGIEPILNLYKETINQLRSSGNNISQCANNFQLHAPEAQHAAMLLETFSPGSAKRVIADINEMEDLLAVGANNSNADGLIEKAATRQHDLIKKFQYVQLSM